MQPFLPLIFTADARSSSASQCRTSPSGESVHSLLNRQQPRLRIIHNQHAQQTATCIDVSNERLAWRKGEHCQKTEESRTWLSAAVGQWAMTQEMQQEQVGFEAENKLLIGLIQAAHTNQSLL
jgi:hypothetical protein